MKIAKKSTKNKSNASNFSQQEFDPAIYGNNTQPVDSSLPAKNFSQLPGQCNSCNGELDEDSQKALLMDGFVFCKYCGSKITR